MRIFAIVLSCALLMCAAVETARPCWLLCGDAPEVQAGYGELWSAGATQVEHFREALQRNPHSAYRWCDLGEALQRTGGAAQAAYCFKQARNLDPHGPPILLREANFHLAAQQPETALATLSRILEEESGYDAIVFSIYDRFDFPRSDILARGIPTQRAAKAWMMYQLEARRLDQDDLWTWMTARRWADYQVAARYLGVLIEDRRFDNAGAAWSKLEQRADPNFVRNGSFEQQPDGTVFDWILPTEEVQATRENTRPQSGAWALQLTFQQRSTLESRRTHQTIPITPGDYEFTAYIAIDAGSPQASFRIFDPADPARLDLSATTTATEPSWHEIRKLVTIPPATRLLQIDLTREGLQGGKVWVDSISLTRSAQR